MPQPDETYERRKAEVWKNAKRIKLDLLDLERLWIDFIQSLDYEGDELLERVGLMSLFVQRTAFGREEEKGKQQP